MYGVDDLNDHGDKRNDINENIWFRDKQNSEFFLKSSSGTPLGKIKKINMDLANRVNISLSKFQKVLINTDNAINFSVKKNVQVI